jgi:exodeoxyribonuclease VII small subunit
VIEKYLTLFLRSGMVRATSKIGKKNIMTTIKKAESLTFEQSMLELETLVAKMEQGDLPLEDALQSFERGIQLARHSQQKLKDAEQKVQILTNQNGQQTLDVFESDN